MVSVTSSDFSDVFSIPRVRLALAKRVPASIVDSAFKLMEPPTVIAYCLYCFSEVRFLPTMTSLCFLPLPRLTGVNPDLLSGRGSKALLPSHLWLLIYL